MFLAYLTIFIEKVFYKVYFLVVVHWDNLVDIEFILHSLANTISQKVRSKPYIIMTKLQTQTYLCKSFLQSTLCKGGIKQKYFFFYTDF